MVELTRELQIRGVKPVWKKYFTVFKISLSSSLNLTLTVRFLFIDIVDCVLIITTLSEFRSCALFRGISLTESLL